MKVDLTGDTDFAAAVCLGVREAMQSPEFLAALFSEAMVRCVWLTCQQVAQMCGDRSPETIRRWAKSHRIEVSTAFGEREPLYSLRSVQAALEARAIRERKPPAAKPVKPAARPNGHRATAPEPLRTVGRLQN